jgi:hypothetical protein
MVGLSLLLWHLHWAVSFKLQPKRKKKSLLSTILAVINTLILEVTVNGMFKVMRHPEIIGAGVKYLSFVIISQMSKAYIAAALINGYLIYLEVRMRN